MINIIRLDNPHDAHNTQTPRGKTFFITKIPFPDIKLLVII